MVIDTTERSFSYFFPINLPRSLIEVSAYHYRSAGRVTKCFLWTRKYTSPRYPILRTRLPEQSLAPHLPQLRTCITPLRYALELLAYFTSLAASPRRR